MQYADIYYASPDGLRLYARDYHTPRVGANTIICLPGLTRNSKDFDALAGHLSDRYRVICPDQRGRGRSARDPNPNNYRPDVYAADMLYLADELGVARFSVIGTSLGALMAVIINALAPHRVSSVVLNDAGPEIDPRGIARIASYVGRTSAPVTSWADAALRIAHVYGPSYPDFGVEDWVAMARDSYVQDGGELVLDYDVAISKGVANGSAAPDLWPLFGALASKPALAIRGASSDIFAESTLQKMQERFPDMRTLTVPNRGHAPTLNEPVVRAAIDDFLASV